MKGSSSLEIAAGAEISVSCWGCYQNHNYLAHANSQLIPRNPLAPGQGFAYNFNTGIPARESAHHFGAWPLDVR